MDRLTILTNKTAYSPGDRVSGKIYLNIPFHQSSTKLNLNFFGYEHYDLLLFLDCNKIRNHSIVYAEWPLYKWDDELPAGHIEVPFSFILPPNIPASFHQDTPEYRAHITYTLEAKLDSKGRSTVTRYKNLVIRRPVSNIFKSFSEERTFPLRACCMSYGFLALKVQIEKDIYSEGDQVMAIVEIDTSHTELDVSKIQFSLIQKTSFRHGYTFTYKTQSQNFPGMPARRGPETKILEFMIPSFIGDDPGDLLSRIEGLGLQTKGNIIHSEFFLEALVDSSFQAKLPSLEGQDIIYQWDEELLVRDDNNSPLL